MITQQIREIHNVKCSGTLKNIGDYILYDYTKYEVDDYLTMAQLNKKRDEYTAPREILTDNNIDFID